MEENKIRLNKYLSDAGVCSRREADRLTEAKKVTIDGRIALLGEKVTGEEKICINSKEIQKNDKKVILCYNKPRGIVCSTVDQEKKNSNNIVTAIGYPIRVYPVGRLDKDSEGLIFLTNDGDIVNKIMRAGNFHEKEYLVSVNQPVTQEFLQKMEKGVSIDAGLTRPCKVIKTGEQSFSIVLTQGLNRQIRKMCEALSYQVVTLKRIRIMNVTLGDLKCGEYREMTDEEKIELILLCKDSRN
ncbi:MAG: pseudouridine synthase [Lachnospiraceae bacterium]|nr:pseudouridine synthase [Lachnospiraceae bacterium]